MFDVETTRALWENAFRGPGSIAKRRLWVDRPSAGIPYLYIRTGAILTAALRQAGLGSEAKKVGEQTEAIARATQLEGVLRDTAR
jgi:hypothetical protein